MSAIISHCGTWRYTLERELGASGPTIGFGLHNPSTADGDKDDPTSRRGIGFGRAWGARKIVYVNPWAGRATKPDDLWKMADPIGPMNDHYIAKVATEVAESGGFFVFAWGAINPPRRLRYAATSRLHAFEKLVRSCGCEIRALGITKNGAPRHPLYLRSDAQPLPWPSAWRNAA